MFDFVARGAHDNYNVVNPNSVRQRRYSEPNFLGDPNFWIRTP